MEVVMKKVDPKGLILKLRAANPVWSAAKIHQALIADGAVCTRREVKAVLKEQGFGEPLTRSIRLRLVKPVDSPWSDVDGPLHALRGVMSRLRDAVTVEVIAAARSGDKPAPTKAARAALAEIQAHTKNEHTTALNIAGAVIDAIQSREAAAARTYLAKRFSRGGGRIPSARYDSPIYVRDGGWSLEVNGHLALSIKLWGGRAPHARFVCSPLRGPHWGIVRALAAGSPEHRAGDLKLVHEKRKDRKTGRKRGWEAIITVTSAAPVLASREGVLAVHRGAHNFLYAATADGLARPLVAGGKLAETKRHLRARRRSLKRAMSERGSGARGRGAARRYATYNALGDKEQRFVRTYCQQAAAAAVALAQSRGCGTIVREDYGGIVADDEETARYLGQAGFTFPYYQLGQAVDWAAQKAGIAVVTVPAEYISTTCLRCGAASDSYRTAQTFHCGECGFDRPVDFVAALHMLRRAPGVDMGVWDERFAALDALASEARAVQEIS